MTELLFTGEQLGRLALQFLLAGAGTLSFAILFACPRRTLPYCGLVGAVGWLVYEIAELFGMEAFAASLLAVIPLTLLARILAMTLRTPVTVFLLTGIFPLVPGAGIYYSAYYFIQGDNALALANGISTFKIAVALAVGIALASDVLASAISAYTYGKSGNLDIKNGAVMMASVLCFTLVGSYVASLVPGTTMGGFSTFMTLLLGVKFIVRPVMTTKSAMNAVSVQKRFAQSLLCGAGVGFICGFIGAGGGMMMLLLLTSVLGYELKTAVGTSVFIMAFTAFTGSVSHFAIGGVPDLFCLICCVLSTLLWARIAAKFANKAEPATLNRATGVVLVVLGAAILAVNYL